jgi:hypothetical protein
MPLPPELRRAISAEAIAAGFPPVNRQEHCEDALRALEARRRSEITCLLKIATMKLSPSRDSAHEDARRERATREMESLLRLLRP